MSDQSVQNSSELLDALLNGRNTTITRDLKLNLKRLLEESALSPQEAGLALLAVATSVEEPALASYARRRLEELGLPSEQIQEAAESAALMAMLNVYYRFRHTIEKEEDYRVAGLRMTALARPLLGKLSFEMLAFAVSVLNGCPSCVRSHELVLRESGIHADKIHDLARLAAVIKGWRVLSTAYA
jgi:alkyl hydroperoxide reductase subunit D